MTSQLFLGSKMVMDESKTWGIIGMGWLGQALSEKLNSKHINNWGTHRQDFDWRVNDFPQKKCDILFLNTPPLTELAPISFVEKIPLNTYDKIFFISSISVYGDQPGVLTESSPHHPKTESGKWLASVEELLLKRFPSQIIIIRPGGLIGGNRHPAVHLAKSQRPCSANTPINLIHRDDLIGIICALSAMKHSPHLINAVTPFHPTKKEYYSAWTEKLGLPAIQFISDNEPNKIVDSELLPTIYPDWIRPLLDSRD